MRQASGFQEGGCFSALFGFVFGPVVTTLIYIIIIACYRTGGGDPPGTGRGGAVVRSEATHGRPPTANSHK